MEYGVKIGDYHSYGSWGLILQEISIAPPTPKVYTLPVPGSNAVLDYTDVLTGGEVKYEQREVRMKFEAADEGFSGMFRLASRISNLLHGKVQQIIFDEDPGYYYQGRCTVNYDKKNPMITAFEIVCQADPYKYAVGSSSDGWLWDTFSFRTGRIMQLDNLQVSGSRTINVQSGNMSTVPIINVLSGSLMVQHKSTTYQLVTGKNRIPEIRVNGKEEASLLFTGTGRVSIEYRGGSL